MGLDTEQLRNLATVGPNRLLRDAADEIDALREALTPFADEPESIKGLHDSAMYALLCTLGDVRRAAALLGGS